MAPSVNVRAAVQSRAMATSCSAGEPLQVLVQAGYEHPFTSPGKKPASLSRRTPASAPSGASDARRVGIVEVTAVLSNHPTRRDRRSCTITATGSANDGLHRPPGQTIGHAFIAHAWWKRCLRHRALRIMPQTHVAARAHPRRQALRRATRQAHRADGPRASLVGTASCRSVRPAACELRRRPSLRPRRRA